MTTPSLKLYTRIHTIHVYILSANDCDVCIVPPVDIDSKMGMNHWLSTQKLSRFRFTSAWNTTLREGAA